MNPADQRIAARLARQASMQDLSREGTAVTKELVAYRAKCADQAALYTKVGGVVAFALEHRSKAIHDWDKVLLSKSYEELEQAAKLLHSKGMVEEGRWLEGFTRNARLSDDIVVKR